MRVVHVKSRAMSGVAIDRSGEVGFPWVGRRVGVSELRRTRLEGMRALEISSPRAAARASLVCEYHAGLWALKSPRMRVLSWGVRRPPRHGEKFGGQEDMGGMYILKILRGLLLIWTVTAWCSVVESLGKR